MKLKKFKYRLNVIIMLCIIPVLFVLSACSSGGSADSTEPAPETKWTIMYYGDADCDLEYDLMEDLSEMKSGFVDGQGVNLIALVDRISGESNDTTTLNEDFSDTRLFRITNGKAWRIGGAAQFPEITTGSLYEANMGDATTLKKFIQYCKANYPAEKYALIISNHGGALEKRNLLQA